MTDRSGFDPDLVEVLRQENDVLRGRIDELEAATTEYRRQMTAVLTSASWRITSPLRVVAGRVRLAPRRAKALPRKMFRRPTPAGFSPVGLFPPVEAPVHGLASADSPLLQRPERTSRGPGAARAVMTRTNRILVVAHVYYPEVWPDIEDRLVRLPESYDLIVSLVRGRAEGLEQHILARFPQAKIHFHENYGRDMGSLVELSAMGSFDGYDAVLKVHTKRSPHRLDGDGWRVALLDGVLPSPAGVRRILELMRADSSVGLVVPPGSVKGEETWGSDRELVEALAARIPVAFDPEQLEYASGSMYWARPWVLQRLADLGLGPEHFEPEADHLDGSTAHALERFIGVMTKASGLDIVETSGVGSRLQRARRRTTPAPRTLAFYLPQYHRIPENDQWWGEGFTDWTSVAAARSLYAGHEHPAAPGELGRYDLRDSSVMRAQAALAAAHGIDGFVMHHYWFDGRPLLETPLQNLLADTSIRFPFALCWANENWTRRWDGLEADVLVRQTYPDGWAEQFYDDIKPALADRRYLRVDGKPLLVIYRVGTIPKARQALDIWRRRAAADGLGGLHILGVLPSREFGTPDPETAGGLDGWVRFPPGSGIDLVSVRDRAAGLSRQHRGDVLAYDAAVDGADLATTGPHGLPLHPGVMPGWDNTARRDAAAYIFHGANPLSFRRWLARAASAAADDDRMLFINAWNEWAEGAHLEPDLRFGRGNLEAVRDVIGVREVIPTEIVLPDVAPREVGRVDVAAAGGTP